MNILLLYQHGQVDKEEEQQGTLPKPDVATVEDESNRTPKSYEEKRQEREERMRRRRKLRNQMRGRTRQKTFPIIEPKSASLSSSANFSACLLIKDDNQILNEWIAHNYHVLRMRRLVVAVDPTSTEVPSKILEKWQNLTNLEVFEWSDKRYMPKHFLATRRPPDAFMLEGSDFHYALDDGDLLAISIHRYRQRVFLSRCMRFLRDIGSNWAIHIDTDEFVVPSKKLRDTGSETFHIPPMEQEGAVIRLLQQVTKNTPQDIQYPCVSLLRVLFGSRESSAEETNLNVPHDYNASQFETLRWRYHALPQNMTLNGNPKAILDVSAIPERYFPKDVVFSIHRPVEELCQRNKDLDYEDLRRQPIAANHYLGSWERYSARMDQRRSRETYEAKVSWQQEVDDGIRGWLKGFVDSVGPKTATKLLGQKYLIHSIPD